MTYYLAAQYVGEYMFCSMKYVKFMVRLKITYSNQQSNHVATSSIMPDIGTLVHEKQHHISL
jgi:hypothetical protein